MLKHYINFNVLIWEKNSNIVIILKFNNRNFIMKSLLELYN